MNMLKLKRENVNEVLKLRYGISPPTLLNNLGLRYATSKSKVRKTYGRYRCSCGNEFEAVISAVNSGVIKSCGCYRISRIIEANSTHGMAYHPLYGTWKGMKARCYNKKAKGYKNYGGRGIKVCDRWLDINNFIEDMYPSYQEDLSLDRIDVNGNYEPTNCRWADACTQAQNSRDITVTNTSGFRGVSYERNSGLWQSRVFCNNKHTYLGLFNTALEAAKAYEIYVRLNNLGHNFTPALTKDEIEEINKQKEGKC